MDSMSVWGEAFCPESHASLIFTIRKTGKGSHVSSEKGAP